MEVIDKTKGYTKFRYFVYTEKGTGRPRGFHKVGDKVTVTKIVKVPRVEQLTEQLSTIMWHIESQEQLSGEIIRLTHRWKVYGLNSEFQGDNMMYRDTWYKVKLEDGTTVTVTSGFRKHIYMKTAESRAHFKKRREMYERDLNFPSAQERET